MTDHEDWQDLLAWTDERLSEGEVVPVAPLVRKARGHWGELGDDALEPASLALVRLARTLERAARLRVPQEQAEQDELEEDTGPFEPPEELLDRLAVLEEFRDVVRTLQDYQSDARRKFTRGAAGAARPKPKDLPDLTADALVEAFETVWRRAGEKTRRVDREMFSVAERMTQILSALAEAPARFDGLFPSESGRMEVIVTFLAVLELVRGGRLLVRQDRPLAPITLTLRPEEAR